MYTLRIVEKDGQIMNHYLGDNYSVTTKEVAEVYEKLETMVVANENTYAILVGNDGKFILPLLNHKKYFIMMESGKTFEKL